MMLLLKYRWKKLVFSSIVFLSILGLFQYWNVFVAAPLGLFTEHVNETGGSPGVLLLWSPFFGDAKWNLPELGRTPFLNLKCPYNNCMVTDDRRYTQSANLVLFHCVDGIGRRWPTSRDPRQIYAAYCWEAPVHANFEGFQNRINLTVTYRRDSDVTDYAGRVKARGNASTHGRYVPRFPLSDTKGSVVWPVSHCTTLSQREDYVQELSRYIDVDVFGKCGSHSCPKSDIYACLSEFERKYKFYLAFENNICVDYITEKLFYPLQYELIPIVLGGGSYEQVAPPGSYIDVRDFRSPRDLARYLQDLATNETAYSEYFQWKMTHEFDTPNLWCQLCRTIVEGSFQKPSREINNWWAKGACQNELVSRLLS